MQQHRDGVLLSPHDSGIMADSALGTERVDLALHVWLELAQVVQELLRRVGRHFLARREAVAGNRQSLGAEMRKLATLGLLWHLRRVGERRLRDAVGRHAE